MSRGDRVFLSYARRDRAAVEALTHALRRLRYDVWMDDALSGGQTWWNVILEQIRGCGVFVACVSPAMIESTACRLETEYAARLRTPILPVAVDRVAPELLPPNLAYLQLVPFSAGDADSAFELAAALRDLPPAQPLPQPLPPPPPVPMSYLTTLAEHVRSPHPLDADAQLALVARLEAAAVQDDDRAAALQLAQQLLGRPDLYHSAARNLERLLNSGPAGAPPERVAPPPPQRQGWWVHSVGGDANTRTLQLQNGQQSWSLRLDFPRWATNKVLVDGQRREITEKLVWIGAGTARCLFTIDRSDGPLVPCEFRIDGVMQLKGLILEVQGSVVHREGTLAG